MPASRPSSSGCCCHERGETQAPVAGRDQDAGDTLVEILISVAILGIVSAALIGGFLTAITTSAVYRAVANSDTVLRTAVDSVTTQMQQAPAAAFGCPAWSLASPLRCTS